MSRPRLLFLSQTLPYPPDAGVKIRTFHVLRSLSRVFDIVALCFYRSPSRGSGVDAADGAKGLREYVEEIETFPIPQEHDRLRFFWDHFRSVLRGRVYTVFAYESRAFRNRLRWWLARGGFDLLHLDSLDLSGYLPLLEGLPVVCVHHDAQSVLLRRRAKVQTSAIRHAYFWLQARLMEREERAWCSRVTLNVTVSEDDKSVLEGVVAGGSYAVVPNGVDVSFFRPREEGESGIVFVGGTSWFPNKDGLEYFGSDILPLIRVRCEGVSVKWVGRCTEEERRRARKRFGIEMTGYVDDIRPYVGSASCYVVPLRVGGGTRIKILDAWAMGKCVVSTSIGCEGLDARDGENILIRDQESAFADAVVNVLRDEQLRAKLGGAARKTAESRYSWEAIGHEMNQRYLDTIRNSRTRFVS